MRNYKRKGPRQWRDKDKRMALAVRMHAEGKSLREIAKELGVGSPQTIANDLKRWDAQRAAAPSNVVSLSKKLSKPAVQSSPAGGEIGQPNWTPDETPKTTGQVVGLTVKEEAMARAVAMLTDRRR